jgi:ABC-type bacteriocin/lantibiotic exporter with double-glycine peptidase domain
LTYRQNKFLYHLNSKISSRIFELFLNKPYSFHLNNNTSKLIETLHVEIGNLNTFILGGITLISEGAILISIVLTLFYLQPFGALLLALIFTPLTFLFLKITKKKLDYWGVKREKLDKNLMKIAMESFSGIKELIVFNKTQIFIDDYNKENFNRSLIYSKFSTINSTPRYFFELISILAILGLSLVLVYRGQDVAELIVMLGIFVAASLKIIPSLNKIISSYQNIKFYSASLNSIYSLLEKQRQNFKNNISKENLTFNETINFKGISFYFHESKMILDNINLIINKGDFIGLIGASGSGKSTFLDILMGLINPTSGDITVDGISMKNKNNSLLNILGYVPQSIFLLDSSIKNNITLGDCEEKTDYNQLNKIIKIAELESFVKEYGLDSTIGERGSRISGGQRQRLGIARALYKNPQILILDEATSALDKRTETKILKNLKSIKNDITIILITHNEKNLELCNNIFNLENGKIYNLCLIIK